MMEIYWPVKKSATQQVNLMAWQFVTLYERFNSTIDFAGEEKTLWLSLHFGSAAYSE